MISLSPDNGDTAAVVIRSTDRAESGSDPERMHPAAPNPAVNANAKTPRRAKQVFFVPFASVRSIANKPSLQPGGMRKQYDRNRVNDW